MSGDAQLMLMIAGVHLLALACVALLMIPLMRDGQWSAGSRSDTDSDDGWGHGPKRPPSKPEPPRGGIPLLDADPARVRLRDHGRLADRLPPRERRPAREPAPRPVRVQH
jgi:hypothetical protein